MSSMPDDDEQRRQDSNSFLDRQYDRVEDEKSRSRRSNAFYEALQNRDRLGLEGALGIGRQGVSGTNSTAAAHMSAGHDGLRLIRDHELERKYRNVDAAESEVSLRGRIIAKIDYILGFLTRAHISSSLRQKWYGSLADLPPSTEDVLSELNRLRRSIDDEGHASLAGAYDSNAMEALNDLLDFLRYMDELADMFLRYRSRYG